MDESPEELTHFSLEHSETDLWYTKTQTWSELQDVLPKGHAGDGKPWLWLKTIGDWGVQPGDSASRFAPIDYKTSVFDDFGSDLLGESYFPKRPRTFDQWADYFEIPRGRAALLTT